jgi:hypothetical protein
MKFYNKIAGAVFAAMLALSLFAPPVSAQPVPSFVGPYNVDIGAVITNVAQGPGTVNSSNQANVDQSGAICTLQQSAVVSSPTTTFAIQGFDAATATWNTLAISGNITTSTTNIYSLFVAPGAVATSVPTNGVVAGLPLPRVWRVQEVVTGAAASTTSKIGCNLVK